MHPRFARERRYRLATRAILILGFAAAVVAYFVAAARPENPLGDPLENKKYIHDLQLYGGTANVLASEFRAWLAGLWYGKNLAYTLAVLTLMLAGLVRFLVDPAHAGGRTGAWRPAPEPTTEGRPPAVQRRRSMAFTRMRLTLDSRRDGRVA